MNRGTVGSIALASVAVAACAGADTGTEDPVPYVPGPGAAWETRAPEDVGMDPVVLAQAVAYAQAHETEQIPADPGAYRTRTSWDPRPNGVA
jgi:hypothetical protein